MTPNRAKKYLEFYKKLDNPSKSQRELAIKLQKEYELQKELKISQ